ncbi:hypothetical protein H8356DRAFT_224805 [Neocallimastix lanati (nom. inval.)]|jgi:hypothetical protein|uniref:G-protein coupled receptors family 3 profile domain-containing protein n=1 Tax=Neocallimastix californiae TaxID=1754190 RepID=A0A1Y2DU59_9FUNG|nr:hypothetical protein H8356DRAFT_224805 [Neocallimastix sp. JGI-2020a]ORY62811.1 hypothetical protein LY90DRAFT_642368 [Neocallimastix californiae]|eukprot:ORY62811.1 hypothetical protein LY90DRAFT_642368 [Neocallimastix californiae]
MINQYFSMNNINDYDVKFSYCSPVSTDGENLSQIYKNVGSPFSIDVEYAKDFNCTLRELKDVNYDMMILDDRFLYADNSYADFILLQNEFDFKRFSDFYADYSNYRLNTDDISYHDKDILNDGKLGNEKRLYGLPYELDFDLLYYHSVNDKSKDSLSLKVNDSFFENIHSSEEILSAGFKDNDDLINFFGEFVRYQYKRPIENNISSYNFLYNEESTELYHSFRNYILKFTGSDIEKTLSTTVEDAYLSFLENENKLFRGKASLYKSLKENPNISIKMNSLPDNISVINEKYLVINRNSLKSTDVLVKIALILTSKEMQIYRSMEIGSIPTFNFKNPSDESVISYCQINSDMCNLLEKLNPIRIRNIFKKNKFSAHYLETRLILPSELKKSLIDPNDNAASKLFMNVLDVLNQSTMDKEIEVTPVMVVFMILNVFTIAVAIYLILFMLKVHRNRKHPYIKAMSPQLANLTIFGILMRIVYPYFYSIVNTRFLCRMSVVLNFFINNLVYIPLFAIIFRIYYIYTNISSVSYGKKLHDSRLIIYISLILIMSLFAYYGISYFDEYNLETDGSLQYYRFLTCVYDFGTHSLISNIYTFILFTIMIAMTFKIRSLSKKYGDTTFIFFIVILLLSSFLFEKAFDTFLTNGSNISFSSIILIFIHIIISLVTVYFLIGNRLLYIKRHPIKNKEKLVKADFNNINNLFKYIPIRKSGNSSFTFFDSSNKSKSANSTNTSSIYSSFGKISNSYINRSEPSINYSNYRSLAQSLSKYNSEDINFSNNFTYCDSSNNFELNFMEEKSNNSNNNMIVNNNFNENEINNKNEE